MKTVRTLIVTIFIAIGAGCDSGGDTATPVLQPTTPDVSGIGRTGFFVGPVTTFGSVVVNGVRYDTGSAMFTINDAPGTEDELRVGDVVVVSGTINADGLSGTADSVSFDDAVTGPVESIDLAGRQLVVLGQMVRVSPDTSFDDDFSPASLEGIAVTQIVEVSGQFDANGDIVATRIEPKPAGTSFEVHGTVSLLDAANTRFTLGNLVVDYSGATLDDFAGGQIAEGDLVEAKGAILGAVGELVATEVERETLLPDANDGDRVEIEGFITRFVSAQDFDVSGLPVTTDNNTSFVGGAAAELGLNIKVEAEGDLDADGVLIATKIDIRRSKAVRVTANADSVDAGNNMLVILGIPVEIDVLTRIEDKSDADVDPLTLADINAADYLEIRGGEFPAGSGTILATILEREDLDNETELQGFVESVSDPSFSILGVTIETSGGTVFRDENDNIISAADFFSQVEVNSLVEAKGAESASQTITAAEVEFENEF